MKELNIIIITTFVFAQFPYPVPVEQSEKQELLNEVSEEAGSILLKVINIFLPHTSPGLN